MWFVNSYNDKKWLISSYAMAIIGKIGKESGACAY